MDSEVSSVEQIQSMIVQILEYLLETCIVQQDQSTLPVFGTSKNILFVSQEEIPSLDSQNKVSTIKSLLKETLKHKLDYINYCIEVYNRSLKCPLSVSSASKVWQALSLATQNALPTIILNILIEASISQKTDDIFSAYSQESHGDINAFLESVSSWSNNGVILPVPLLQATLKEAYSCTEGKQAVVVLLTSAMNNIKTIKRPDEILTKGSKIFNTLQILLQEMSVQEIVGENLLHEIFQNKTKLGHYFEENSLFSPLLSRSTFIQKVNPLLLQNTWYSCFINLRGFPTVFQGDVEQLHSIIQDGCHKCLDILYTVFRALLKGNPSIKNNVLTWFAAAVSLNEARAGPKYELKKGNYESASDGFLINFCFLLLKFCQPFFSTDPLAKKLPLIVPEYPSSCFCRLYFQNEPCLAHGFISSGQSKVDFLDYEQFQNSKENFKFITEIFFITLRALHIGLLPIADTFLSTLSDVAKEIERKGGQDKLLSDLNGLYMIACSCALLDPLLVQQCCQFYITNAVWLTMVMQSCLKDELSVEENQCNQRKLFSTIPEHAVKDMVRWFLFVLRTRPKLLQGLQLTPFIDCCINLLERPDLLPGPVAQTQIISVLLACVGQDKKTSQRLLHSESWGDIRSELAAIVQGSPAFQSRLGPALLHSFSAVGVVEGLDVDKENFDKYAARYDITQLLIHLWSRIDCRESIVQQTGTHKFLSFLGAIFDTLLYQLNDSLLRITNIHRIELEKDNNTVWSTLNSEEKARKEGFLSGERRAAKSLLNMGMTLLSLLESVCQVESACKDLCVPPLSGRAAASIIGFLDMLCGARQSELKIKDPEQINFNPRKIVTQLATVTFRLWQTEKSNVIDGGFLKSLANHPDYNKSVIVKVASILERHHLCEEEVISGYNKFIIEVEKLSSVNILAQTRCAVDMATDDSHQLGVVAEWQKEAESVIIDRDCLIEMYVAALQENVYDNVKLRGVHTLESMATSTLLDPRSQRLLAILRDLKQLQESLSLHPDSSIFVRQDEERMDLVRVLITGPVNTPYNYGCFIFDIYYSANYPNDPPIVILVTTGNGTVRFNPNLYADGKVCLSLLGTWHGGDSSEKWNPTQSNLLQVLISIQGLILIPEPIYNEPGYEALQGTQEGKRRSDQYNAYIQISTIRHAILEQLRHPPTGFEDTIKIHFMLLKDSILCQCSKWLKNTVSSDHELKLRKAINELRLELDQI